MTRLPIACVLVGLAALAPAVAQDVRKVDPRERLEQEVDEKARRMREGKLVRTNVRVTVRLENGSRMRGIVKNGRFIERHDGLSFVPSDLSVDGAGLRLWYTDQGSGYVFLPYATIRSHSIGQILTDEEVKAIGLRMEQLEAARKARAAAAGRSPAGGPPGGEGAGPGNGAGDGPGATPPGGVPPGGTAKPGQKAPESRLTDDQRLLLEEFPPEQGWSPAKLEKLQRDKIIIDRFPNAQEARFIEVYADWKAAYDIQQEEQAAAEAAKKTGGDGPPVPPAGGQPGDRFGRPPGGDPATGGEPGSQGGPGQGGQGQGGNGGRQGGVRTTGSGSGGLRRTGGR